MLGTCECFVEFFERKFCDIWGLDNNGAILLLIAPQNLACTMLSMALLASDASRIVIKHLRILLLCDERVIPFGQNDQKN